MSSIRNASHQEVRLSHQKMMISSQQIEIARQIRKTINSKAKRVIQIAKKSK